jgi:hypothetical protein
MFYRIKQWPHEIKEGIKSLIIWFPIIWKDRWYDHCFIYSVIRHKLNLMEKKIRHQGIHVKHIADADKMKKCVILLDRLIKDEYHENVHKDYYKKWGQPEMNFKDSTEHPGYSVMDIKYPNVKTPEDDKLQTKQFKLKMKSEQEMREQDLDLLFTTMRKHIQTWWD